MLKVLQEKTTAASPGTTRSSPYHHDCDDVFYAAGDGDDGWPHQGKAVAHLQALATHDKVEPSARHKLSHTSRLKIHSGNVHICDLQYFYISP